MKHYQLILMFVFTALIFPLTSISSLEAMEDEFSEVFNVPSSDYVDIDRPPCGEQVSAFDMLNDPEVLKAVDDLFGKKAAGAVIIAGKRNRKFMKLGGGLAKFYRDLTDQGNCASCITKLIRLPEGAEPVQLIFSDRNGIGVCAKVPNENHNSFDFHDIHCGDWSEWRNVVTRKNYNGRWFVIATAANWKHDEASQHILTIRYRK